jgi:hypothetical protein
VVNAQMHSRGFDGHAGRKDSIDGDYIDAESWDEK